MLLGYPGAATSRSPRRSTATSTTPPASCRTTGASTTGSRSITASASNTKPTCARSNEPDHDRLRDGHAQPAERSGEHHRSADRAAAGDLRRPALCRPERRADAAGRHAQAAGVAARRRGLQPVTTRRWCAAAGASTWRPWNYGAAGTTGWSQYGYSATTEPAAVLVRRADHLAERSVPRPASCSRPATSLGMLTNVGAEHDDAACRTRAHRRRSSTRVDLQREFGGGVMLGVGYTGLDRQRTSRTRARHQHQPARSEVPEPASPTRSCRCPTRSTASRRPGGSRHGRRSNSASCCGRFRSSATCSGPTPPVRGRSTTRSSSRGASGPTTCGASTSATRYSRLMDNQVGASNYYSRAPGVQNNYVLVPWSATTTRTRSTARSLLDSPHKVTISPTLLLPFGEGKKFLANNAVARRAARRLVDHRRGAVPERVSRSASART